MMKEIHVYTDGSHLDKQHGGRLGCGGVLVIDGKAVKTFSQELTNTYMSTMFGTSQCSNPSAEFVAVYLALKSFGKELKNAEKIVFHADYIGITEWMMGKWKVKETVIKNIKAKVDKELETLGIKDKVTFKWVKGHQNEKISSDAYWNNFVDKLAKGE